VTPALIAEVRRKDLQVVCWTVNHPAHMRMLAAAGVDGIMSDYPDRLVAAVKKRSRERLLRARSPGAKFHSKNGEGSSVHHKTSQLSLESGELSDGELFGAGVRTQFQSGECFADPIGFGERPQIIHQGFTLLRET